MINLSTETFAQLQHAQTLRFKANKKLDVSLSLSQMKGISEALSKCVSDLQEVWNVGESRAHRVVKGAQLDKPYTSLFSPDDYPEIALRNDQSGTLNFVVLVDEKGSVADCMIDQTSGIASLDTQTCYIIRTRAKFMPAIGAGGQPVKSVIDQRVTWRTVTPPTQMF